MDDKPTWALAVAIIGIAIGGGMFLWEWLSKLVRRLRRTPIESKLAEAIQRSRTLAPATEQYRIYANGRLLTIPDFAYPDLRIAIFCDGWAYHGNPETVCKDAWKRNRLAADGWIVLVFWGKDIYRAPERCVRMIERAFRNRTR